MESLPFLYAAALGYFLGTIPFGLLLTRMAGMEDIRNIGSGNIGATNVLRTGKKGLAASTLIMDAAKAAIAVLLARYLWGDIAAMTAGFFAFIGHIFPLWLGFKGGKGVAAMIGALLALSWPVGLGFCAIWLLTAFVKRQSSLAALVGAAFAPILAWFIVGPALALTALALAILLFYRHHENIRRLLDGSEPKIGGSKK
ncbi:MAG: glycerol-3-phosphate 1-O-acyltransferase PlsY [Devosiaceae bacterium]|nr:glycerol-3-phosphate 1-O-acyltransferase PlsY [Devosiaceae bacterium]